MNRRIATAALAAAVSLSLTGCGTAKDLAGVRPAPTENVSDAPISAELAQSVAARVLDTAAEVAPKAGAEGDTARAAVMTGTALDLAKARVTMGTAAATGSALERPDAPKVIGVSAGQAFPRLILASTLARAQQRQYLEVLSSGAVTAPYLLENRVPMLPGTSLPGTGEFTKGATVVAPDNATGAVLAPQAAVAGYAAVLAYPNPAPSDVIDVTDSYATALKASQAAQVSGLGSLATLAQTHTAVPEATRAFRLADGSTLVLGRINRVDTITAGENTKELTVPEALQKAVGAATASKTITVNAIESVALLVPASGKGKVKLIGVVEQLSGGSAS